MYCSSCATLVRHLRHRFLPEIRFVWVAKPRKDVDPIENRRRRGFGKALLSWAEAVEGLLREADLALEGIAHKVGAHDDGREAHLDTSRQLSLASRPAAQVQ